MADKKISQLTAVSTPLAGTEVLPIVQSGVTKKVTALELTGTTVDPSGNVTIPNGNLIQGTAAKGINFTANTPAAGMTSQLLNWYEEGAFTPTDNSGAGLTITKNEAYYTRIGRIVNFYLDVTYPSTANGNSAYLGGLPFAPGKDGGGSIGYQTITSLTQLFVNVNATLAIVRILNNTGLTLINSELSGKRFQITGQYIV